MTTLIRYRWFALAALLLATAAMLPGAGASAVPDNALTVWFLESDPALQQYNVFQEQFGNDEVALLLVESPGGALSDEGLDHLRDLTARLEAIDGVARVHSILTMRDAWRIEDGVRFDTALAGGLERMVGNPLFEGRLISADGSQAMLHVEMAAMADFDARRDAIVGQIQDVRAELGNAGHVGGIGIIYSGLNLITQHDFGLFVGLGYLLIFIAMGWLFRSWRLVLAAMGVVSIGTLVALGIYGYAGHQLNMVTVVLPTLIIVLGLADAVHFPAAFVEEQEARPGAPRHEVVAAALSRIFVPCLITSLTTMAGFAALLGSPMAVIRHLGGFAALGVGAAFIASLVLMAPALVSLPEGWKLPRNRAIHGQLDAIGGALRERRPLLLGLTAVLLTLSIAGATRVVTDTYTIGYLPDDHVVVTDHEAIEATWGPYSVLDFLVAPADGGRVDSAEILAATRAFEASARELPQVHDGYGLHTIYRRMADVLGHTGPLAPDLIAQLRLLLEIQGFTWDRTDEDFGDNFLAPLQTEDASLGRVTLVGTMMSARELEVLLAELQTLADEAIGDLGTVQVAGYPPLYSKIVDYAMSSQIRGFFGALTIIFVLMLLWLRSLRLALISLVPNVFPVVVMMGVMGVTGIHLDIATATVAAIVIGVSIDDTVHFLLHWREAELDGKDWDAAVAHTHRHAGVPAVVTTLLLVIGYPVLMLAEVKTVVAFGLLTSVAAVAALYADLIILPLLLRWFPRRAPA
ncbi:MAG: MMPL family transporter [Proteobacteria bacterium]|nr:MMPL family transporter [Pseudomonadota bacterium]